MNDLARLSVEHVDDVVLASVEGEIDLSNAAELKAALVPELVPGQRLALDLSRVTFVDSAGVRLLVELSRALASTGGDLHLVAPPGSAAHRVVQATRLETMLRLHATRAAALR